MLLTSRSTENVFATQSNLAGISASEIGSHRSPLVSSVDLLSLGDRLVGASSTSLPINIPILPNPFAPRDLQFSLNKSIYNLAETLTITDGRIYDFNTISDLAKIDFWLGKPNGSWEDIPDATSFGLAFDIGQPFDIRQASFSYTFSLQGLPAGNYSLWARGQDRSGNLSAPFAVNFTIDDGITLGTRVDFNGDGKTDFLRQEQGSNVARVLLASSNGNFTQIDLSSDYDLNPDLTRIYTGDFNGDGKTDFLRQEKGIWDDDASNTANVFLSNGNGTFRRTILPESFDLKGDLTNLHMGDFNGDGRTDFLRQEKGRWDNDDNDNSYTNIFFSNGDGNFNRVSLDRNLALTLKGDLTNLYMGDFDGDGKTDFLRQEKGGWDNDDINTANVFLSRDNGVFVKADILLPDGQSKLNGDFTNLYVGDFNGDGKSDFLRQEKGVWGNVAGNTAHVCLSNGNGTFIWTLLPEIFDLNGNLTNIYLGDFNGDGKTDILRQEKGVWDNDRNNTANVLLSLGNGNFDKIVLNEDYYLPGDFTNIFIGDFNGDRRADFLRQEKDVWDDDSSSTANIFLSRASTTGSLVFDNSVLPETLNLKGDLTRLSLGQSNLSERDATTVEILRGSLGADRFTIRPDMIRTIISGNGNVDFGQGRRDVLDLSTIPSSDVSLNIAGRNGGTGVVYNPGSGNRIFDAIDFNDGRQILFEGIDRIQFSNQTIDLSTIPNDPLFTQQWNLHMMGVQNAWRFGQGTNRVVLGVQDSGAGIGPQNAIHPETRLTTYFLENNPATNGQNFRDEGAASGSHGAAVQSIMGAASNNGVGMSGINWNSPIFNIDVIPGDSQSGDLSLTEATRRMIDWLQPGQRLVINMSLTGGDDFAPLVAQYRDQVLFVIATGNGDNSVIDFPARLAQTNSNVIAVGASWGRTDVNGRTTNPGDRITYLDAWGSNYGNGITLMGPSEVIAANARLENDTPVFDYFTGFNGTSAATPNVAGVASLIWSANPNLTATQVREILTSTAYDLGAPGYDVVYGNGFVNADAAVRRAIAIS